MKKNLFFIACVFLFATLYTGCKKDEETISLAGITISKTSANMKPGMIDTLSVVFFPENASNKDLEWTSSDSTVASISKTGILTAVGVGNATITVTAKSDKKLTATCDVSIAWETLNDVSGNVSGKWAKNTTVNVIGHITVPVGQTLTIEEGVQVIFNDNGVGASHTKIEFMVAGNIYCKGTTTNPILFSVAASKRVAENTFAGLWGGIIATKDCAEMLFDNVIIEYTGGNVVADSPSAVAGIYTPGADITPHITTNNTLGKYVIINCTLRNGRSDALYFIGGQGIIANNIFSTIGETGAEAINMKAGTKVDAAFNLIFSPNTNGLKLSSSGQDDANGRPQALVKAYNNTIINAGWRRNGIKGGGAYIEKGALVSVFNNLFVNCKFMAMTPKFDKPDLSNGADNNSFIDYNFYASGSQQSTLSQDNPTTLTSYMGYVSNQSTYYHDGRLSTPKVDFNSKVSASAGDATKDPKFVSYGFNTVALNSYIYENNWDFHVLAGSPVLSGAFSSFTGSTAPYWSTVGITINGVEYKSPSPAAYFGAYGTK